MITQAATPGLFDFSAPVSAVVPVKTSPVLPAVPLPASKKDALLFGMPADQIELLNELGWDVVAMDEAFSRFEGIERQLRDAHTAYLVAKEGKGESAVMLPVWDDIARSIIYATMRGISSQIHYTADLVMDEVTAKFGTRPHPLKIFRYLADKHLATAEKTIRDMHEECVRFLCPYEDNLTLQSMVTRRTVRLRGSAYDEVFKGSVYVAYSTGQGLVALEALMKVKLFGESIRKAGGREILDKLNHHRPFGEVPIGALGIEKIKPYKNWRIDIVMEDTSKAFAVAEIVFNAEQDYLRRRDAR